MRGLAFIKGHGTSNDFVLLPDGAGDLALTAEVVRAICDRRTGIGADGVLRVVLSANEPAAAAMASEAQWFMDYRNADGSIAEMCGNGARVFARYLIDAGLAAPGELRIATRAGVVVANLGRSGPVRVTLGPYDLPMIDDVKVRTADETPAWSGVAAMLPNPHAVVVVNDLAEAGLLAEPPIVAPAAAFPDGVNVEFVVVRGERHVEMRVYERGAGETYSCGTGAAAVAVVQAQIDGALPVADDPPVIYTVDVRGGRLEVTIRADRLVELSGPAMLVAEGTIDLDAL